MNQQHEFQKSDSAPVAAWGMKSEDSRGRRHEEPEHPYRTVFQRDRDRIIHCTAFRRLQYKTQVFVIHEGDYYRTRLTHTQEVSQISRTIARALGLNGDLTEAVSLSHDLGHTPFGHSGEDALDQCLQETADARFRHNRQSLRIIEQLEDRYPSFRGLNASWELRESVVKHGFPDHPTPPDRYDPELAPLLEERVVDVTDAVAYTNHDLDDGLKSGILSRDQLQNVSLWSKAVSVVQNEHGKQPKDRERSQVIRYLINKMVTDLIETTRERLDDYNIDSVDDVRNADHRLVGFSAHMREQKEELSDFLHERMYCHHRVIRMQERAKRIVRELFDEYMRCPQLLPETFQEWIESAGKPRAIADYIAGMTDRYAIQEHQELFGKGP
jgi:dGTPase